MQAEHELFVALAMSLSCIPVKPPADPNRQHYVQLLLHSLPATLQQLASQPHSQLTAQQAQSTNASADKGLRHTRTLMMFMQSWRDSQQAEQSLQSANPAVEALVCCWPLIEQALACGSASIAVQERTAACCTAAVRMHLAASMPAMPGILHAAACGVASGHSTAHLWVPTLAAALDQLEGQRLNQVLVQLRDALSMVDSSAPAQRLTDRAAADSEPDYSLVSFPECSRLDGLNGLIHFCCQDWDDACHGQLQPNELEPARWLLLAGHHAFDQHSGKKLHKAAGCKQ